MTALVEKIKQFNHGRNPKFLKQKYKNMRSDAFVFYRGSCHLFYQDLPAKSFFDHAPASWVCGDLHLENFGCYKADNRVIYFDINDFDEAVLAPCLFDVARLLTSILLASDMLKTDAQMSEQLCKRFLKNYATTLRQGSARFMEEDVAVGVVKDFLDQIRNRKREAFINDRTIKTNHQRKLLIDDKHVSQISETQKQHISDTIELWAKDLPDSKFYQVLDAGYRIAGTGSLGLERYVLLLEGHGAGKHYLLDMKIANPSCLNPALKLKQPTWKNEAERIIQIQQRMQIFPQALLSNVKFDKHWFVLKELQPTQDKMDLAACKGKSDKLDLVITTFASIVAWDQLRSSGRQGSATADELMDFANSVADWKKELIGYSAAYAKQVQKDYQKYCKAYDAGYFDD